MKCMFLKKGLFLCVCLSATITAFAASCTSQAEGNSCSGLAKSSCNHVYFQKSGNNKYKCAWASTGPDGQGYCAGLGGNC